MCNPFILQCKQARDFAFAHNQEFWHVKPCVDDKCYYIVRVVGSSYNLVIVNVTYCSSDFMMRLHGNRPFKGYFRVDEFVFKEDNK